MKINVCYAKFRAGSGKQNKMWVQVHILVTQHDQTWHLRWFAGSKLWETICDFEIVRLLGP